MTIYSVWTNEEYEASLLALFTNEAAANEYAARHHDVVVWTETVYTTAAEAETAEE